MATVAVLVLTACSSGDEAPTSAELDDQFIDMLVASDVVPADATVAARADLVEAGRGWCDTLAELDAESFPTSMGAALRMTIGDASPREMAELGLMLGAAVQVYCPETGERLQ